MIYRILTNYLHMCLLF